MSDLELEQRALEACGYRVHVKERNGTRWLMAVKGLGVRYEHWHPLTNIHQAMQLLIDAELELHIASWSDADTPNSLIARQCRTIVTACASLKPVR